MLDQTTLEKHLDALKWSYEPHGDRTLRSEHESEEGPLTVYLRILDEWLVASVVPFLKTSGKNSFELSRWLLRQNRDMFQAKFAYDEDGDVVLSVELPIESLDFSEISTALESLISHTVAHRATLREAAQAARRIRKNRQDSPPDED